MEWPQSLASVGACHLHTDVSVPTGPHSIQDTAQQGISGRDRERGGERGRRRGEEGRGGGGERGRRGVRCVYESISKHYTHSVTLPKGYPKNEDTSLKRKFFLTEQQFLHAINP